MRRDLRPCRIYVDEFQSFISPTIAENLDQSRGFGLSWTMAHQFPMQLLDRGDYGKQLWHSVVENASSKVVFRMSHEENLRPLAQWLFTGTFDPDEIKHILHSTKVMGYREEVRRIGHTRYNQVRWWILKRIAIVGATARLLAAPPAPVKATLTPRRKASLMTRGITA